MTKTRFSASFWREIVIAFIIVPRVVVTETYLSNVIILRSPEGLISFNRNNRANSLISGEKKKENEASWSVNFYKTRKKKSLSQNSSS